MHFLVSFAETEIPVHVLESLKALVQNCDGSLDDGAILEAVDIPGMHFLDTFAGFRARSVAGHAFTVQRLLFGRARSYASTVVFQKVFRTSSHAGCTIRVLAVRIRLPRIRGRIVSGRNNRRNPRVVMPRVVKLWAVLIFNAISHPGNRYSGKQVSVSRKDLSMIRILL